jgi:hypothetical protein
VQQRRWKAQDLEVATEIVFGKAMCVGEREAKGGFYAYLVVGSVNGSFFSPGLKGAGHPQGPIYAGRTGEVHAGE